MKKYYLFIALAMVAGMTVSCKNNKNAEADAEVVEAAKTILADDVLATLDEYAKNCVDETGNVNIPEIISSNLTEEEKLVKPDYLLEAEEANALVTKSQKVAALAILHIERNIRQAYGVSTDETDATIAHLTAELNDPISADDHNKLTPSEKVKKTYEQCKENGDVSYFWQFVLALQTEFDYLISKNIDVVFRNLTEEQYQSVRKRFFAVADAVRTLAEYDPEVKQAWDAYNAGGKIVDDVPNETMEDAKNFFKEMKDTIAARRAALLK